MKRKEEEARLSLLHVFWESMLHPSGCPIKILLMASYGLKCGSTIFQPCSSRALYRTGVRTAYEALFFCAE